MEEIWKPVVGYEGLYEVSNIGRVKSIRFGEKIMKLSNISSGYLQVGLRKKCEKQKYFLVHRLVLIAFNGFCQDKVECDHINRNKMDNRLNNLRWVTHSENQLNKKSYGKSKYKGVNVTYSMKRGNRYDYISAQIIINKKLVYLGVYKTEEEAHEAYKKAYLNHYGYEWMD